MLFLYGPPGSGKSTLGQQVAKALQVPFWDLDTLIVQHTGRSIPEIFAQEGEAGFRERERQVLRDLLRTPSITPGVIALGGGALLDPDNRALVEKHGVVVCLQATLETLQQRLAQTGDHQRPLLPKTDPQALARLLQQRAQHYASFPRQVCVDDSQPQDLVWPVLVQAGWFRLQAMPPAYEVRVWPGGLQRLPSWVMRWVPGATAWALVSDQQVFHHYGQQVLHTLLGVSSRVHRYAFPPGEGSKTPQSLLQLWRAWLEAGLDRSSGVVALGGGVIGDLAGFAAATFMRGVPWVNLPTSLLAMVDASIGGKTGIDLPEAKNAVGAFYPPKGVLIDPQVLSTLPREQWRYGMAEVIKHALLGDPELWQALQQGWAWVKQDPDSLVRRAVAVKIRVVEEDPWERTGSRAALNAGHTVGHALEAALEYRLAHGAAVSIGLVVEAALAEALGLAEPEWHVQVAQILARFQLPTQLPPRVPWDRFYQALYHDKKRRAGQVRFSLPVAVGRVETGVEVPRSLLEAVLKRFQTPPVQG